MNAAVDMSLHPTYRDQQRELPSSIDAEKALLGAILINADAIDAIRAPLEPAHFYEPLHGQIFDAMVDLRKAGRSITTITVKSYVPDTMIDGRTPAQYLAKLAADAVNVVNAPDYADGIMDRAARRALVSLGHKIEDAAFSLELDIMDEFEALRARFEDVARALNGQPQAKTLADAAKRSLASTALAYQGKGLSGVDYGISFLMNMIGPLLPGQLVIMGGMTKHGKSSLMEQIVAGAAMNGHPIWINSGEMKDEELARRALARITDIKAWQQVRGKVSERDYERLETARRNAETWQERVFIRDDSMTLRQIEREIADFAKFHEGGMAVVDHVGLVEKDQNHARTSDAEFASIVTRKLKVSAGKNRLPIVAAAQLKKNIFEITDRTITRKTYMKVIGRRPKAADLFGSCEKDADHVITPFRAEAVMDENEPAEMDDLHSVWEEVRGNVRDRAEIVLALSRHTRWPQRKQVGWDGPRTMFTDPQQGDQGRMF
ncbi:hypothetical protein IB238_09175 [Rhizobium sp. ARZ01]|uniref:replicative DNA helicase n=1 Tax=Rhizobium sp. ARZ01 TaxID=2769313 RepID=UPI00178211EC|nr:DnaB-like helicase C-terminal domain-containing protein [Rhizobium sp. ARZ01]MBD9372790.1 hypothetical protein [Rhizobium sp. ARZ01]